MGFDTNGNWTSDFYPETDRDEGIAILASKFQQLIQTDIKGGFDNCLTRDGAGKPEANLNFNGHKITNLADGEIATDAVTKGQLDTAVATPASETEAGTIEIATSAEALEATDDTKAMTPKKVGEVMRTLSSITTFCANSGNVDLNGEADLLSASLGTVSFKVDDGTSYAPLVCTPANSQNSFTLTSIEAYDASALADGTYVLTVTSDGTISASPYDDGYYTYTRKTAPSTPYLWFDVSTEPYKAFKYENSAWTQFAGVPLGIITMSSGAVDDFSTLPYNENGFKADIFNMLKVLEPDYSAPTSVPAGEYTAPADGWLLAIATGGSDYNYVSFTIDGTLYLANATSQFNTGPQETLYVAKGQKVTVSYGGYGLARFVPIKGAIK